MANLNIKLNFFQQQLDEAKFSYTIVQNGVPMVYTTGVSKVDKTFKANNNTSANRIFKTNYNNVAATFSTGSGFNNITNNASVYDVNITNNNSPATSDLYVVGSFTTFNGASRNRIAKITQTGAPGFNFNPTPLINNTIRTVDGPIGQLGAYIGGDFTQPYSRIAFLTPSGGVSSNFNPSFGLNNTVYKVLQQGLDVFACGAFTTQGSGGSNYSANRIAKYLITGAKDTSFVQGTGFNNPTNNAVAYDMTFSPTFSHLYVGGSFTTYNGTSVSKICKISTTGTRDLSFVPPTINGDVRAIAVDSSNNVYIGGQFTLVGTYSRNKIAKLTSTGSIDLTFDPGTGFDDTVNKLIIDTAGNLVAGGLMTTYNGTPIARILKLSSTASMIGSFDEDSGYNGGVNALYDNGSQYLVGGDFTNFTTAAVTPTQSQFTIPVGATMGVTITNSYNNLVTYNPKAGLTYSLNGNTIDINYTYNTSDDIYVTDLNDIPGYLNIVVGDIPLNEGDIMFCGNTTPYYITYTNTQPYSYAIIDFWVYSGGVNDAPVQPTDSYRQPKVIESDTTITFELGSYVKGLLNPKLDSAWFTPGASMSHNFGEAIWFKYRIAGYDANNTEVSYIEGKKIATRGWGFFDEGPNPPLRNGYVVSDVTNNYLTTGNKAWKAELQLPSTTASNINDVILRTNIAGNIDSICESNFEAYQVVFLNENGVFEGFSFPKANQQKITIEQKTYAALSRNPQSYSTTNHYNRVTNKSATKEIILNTNLLSDSDVQRLLVLVNSELHYLVDTNQNIMPVIFTNTDFELKQSVNAMADIQYSFTFKFANDLINNIR